ncbi:TatA/E family twin arginine-targeting protein translocase [Halomicronema sp. CCY15110]|uniref:TatA/E family twin arginine-targeting protein translocase n=1 Tax=Halomicronema sp. CCY15110 TaxID=2767773 RepID=UPI00194DC663|nr:TatA/E family twin arginine-targeting protein translocase [Halomicronema sp. CCY15110]
MNIFGIGLPEMALILVIALLVFGPKKLPEVGRSLAQALGSFKKAQQEFESELKRESAEIEKSMKAPMKAEIAKPDAKALPQDEVPAADVTTATEAPEAAETTEADATAEEVVSDASTPSA